MYRIQNCSFRGLEKNLQKETKSERSGHAKLCLREGYIKKKSERHGAYMKEGSNTGSEVDEVAMPSRSLAPSKAHERKDETVSWQETKKF